MEDQEQKFVVQILMRCSLSVTAYDEIQAEIAAFKALRPDQRNRIEAWRVCDAYAVPLHEQEPNKTMLHGSWYSPDLEWLRSHLD